jgi:hypothetical protein
MIRIIYLLISFFLVNYYLISCNSKIDIKITGSVPIIDLATVTHSKNELKATSFFSHISYVPLETKENCLLGQSKICYADSSQIVVLSESELYRFSGKGKFMNKIGNKGRGPKEYLHPGNVFYDQELSLFKIVDLQSKRIIWFSSEGDYIRDEKYEASKNQFDYGFIDAENVLTTSRGVNENDNKLVRDEIHIVNYNVDTLFTMYDDFMPGAKKIAFFHYPSIQWSSPHVYMTLPFNDTIFSVDSKKGFLPVAVHYFGQEKMPRHIAEDFTLSKKNRSNYITGLFSLVSNKYIFLSFNKKNAKLLAVFNRETNSISGHDNLLFEDFLPGMRQIGILDDIGKKDVKFFPEYISGNIAYDLIYNSVEGITANENPVLVMGYMKK